MWNESSAKPCTRILFLQLLLGVLLLGGVFLLAVNEDIAATQRTMVNTVNYVKEQCNRYSRIGLADESKSLMRIVESANQTAHRLEETTRPVSADFLHTCMKDCFWMKREILLPQAKRRIWQLSCMKIWIPKPF